RTNAHLFCRSASSIFEYRRKPPVRFELTRPARNLAVFFLNVNFSSEDRCSLDLDAYIVRNARDTSLIFGNRCLSSIDTDLPNTNTDQRQSQNYSRPVRGLEVPE